MEIKILFGAFFGRYWLVQPFLEVQFCIFDFLSFIISLVTHRNNSHHSRINHFISNNKL